MARFDIDGFDEVIRDLENLGRFDEIAPKIIEESIPILEAEVRKEVSRHKDTGAMAASIKTTGATAHNDGYYAAVRPTGKDEKGVRNMEKLAYLEYGTSREAARPILTKAVNSAEPKVLKKQQEVFEREVGL